MTTSRKTPVGLIFFLIWWGGISVSAGSMESASAAIADEDAREPRAQRPRRGGTPPSFNGIWSFVAVPQNDEIWRFIQRPVPTSAAHAERAPAECPAPAVAPQYNEHMYKVTLQFPRYARSAKSSEQTIQATSFEHISYILISQGINLQSHTNGQQPLRSGYFTNDTIRCFVRCSQADRSTGTKKIRRNTLITIERQLGGVRQRGADLTFLDVLIYKPVRQGQVNEQEVAITFDVIIFCPRGVGKLEIMASNLSAIFNEIVATPVKTPGGVKVSFQNCSISGKESRGVDFVPTSDGASDSKHEECDDADFPFDD